MKLVWWKLALAALAGAAQGVMWSAVFGENALTVYVLPLAAGFALGWVLLMSGWLERRGA